MNPYELTIAQARDMLRRGEISSTELTESVLSRIGAVNDRIGAYLTVCGEEARAAAREADKQLAAGGGGPLCGIPIAVKDVICTMGIRTTAASRILENFVPPYDATVVARLREAGAVIVGKTNMDEFAMGASTENSGYFPARNPWNTDHIPGGSSGGSAAAVAADMCLGSLGTDTGGSIRQPSSHCGVTGLKPTYGRVSRFGLIAFASSLDQAGPICKDVRDCAMLMEVIAGHDPRDSTSIPEPVPAYTDVLGRDIRGMRLGLPREYAEIPGLSPEVRAVVDRGIKALEDRGAELVEVSIPRTGYAVAAYYVIAPAEASSNLARYDGVKYGFRKEDAEDLLGMYHKTRSTGFGQEVKRRVLIGTYALSAGYYEAYYGKAGQVRTLLMQDFRDAFTRCDAIVCPVTPKPAFRLGEKADDPLAMYLEDIFTISANLSGIPGLSVPCGFSADGMPIGLQVLGRHLGEESVLRIGYQVEEAMGIAGRRPAL
ncbi:MAG: Asp-tRNA(Asn)/Glu-tRNA(Gln) amidotransferase subunit GatA [Desulfatibacillaceae bacterium]